ncbi:MAG: aldo/keto reductase [Deltaproteobacteria bacterium]|nr:aldo/keto reductase [Deltaproteobacteria bacterium]
MQYRKLGQTGYKVSALGFGAMRLPLIDETIPKKITKDPVFPKVDETESIKMIRYAIDHGLNYIDTGYFYHGGESEKIVNKALRDGYREKVKIATKLPVYLVEKKDDFDLFFDEQSERLQTDKIDFYLLHALSGLNWPKVRDLGVIQWLERLLAKGKIGHTGFSFHDTLDPFKKIIDSYDNWSVCQLQYNYMDINDQAGKRGIEYAASKDMGIIIMEPLRGGQLTKTPPKKISNLWDSAEKKRSLAEWGLQWLWDQEEISVVLSGMSTMDQVIENISLAKQSGSGEFTDADRILIKDVRKAYKGLRPIPCTSCRYCMPCPNGVDIPGVFNMYNDSRMYEDPKHGIIWYNSPYGFNQEQRADKCTRCGTCLAKCPQHIDIPDCLLKAHSEMFVSAMKP